MKVHIYKLPDGKMDVLVTASQGRGLGPVLLKDVARHDVQDRVRPVIDAMRRKRAQPEAPPE